MQAIDGLNEVRRRLGFSQKLVADSMGVSAPVLSRASKGNPTQEFLQRCRNALDDISRSTTVEQIARIAKTIALRHHMAELYLFGSMARGEGRADSFRNGVPELACLLAVSSRNFDWIFPCVFTEFVKNDVIRIESESV